MVKISKQILNTFFSFNFKMSIQLNFVLLTECYSIFLPSLIAIWLVHVICNPSITYIITSRSSGAPKLKLKTIFKCHGIEHYFLVYSILRIYQRIIFLNLKLNFSPILITKFFKQMIKFKLKNKDRTKTWHHHDTDKISITY